MQNERSYALSERASKVNLGKVLWLAQHPRPTVENNQGCGVGVGGVACFQLESESVLNTAGVGFKYCWSRF